MKETYSKLSILDLLAIAEKDWRRISGEIADKAQKEIHGWILRELAEDYETKANRAAQILKGDSE